LITLTYYADLRALDSPRGDHRIASETMQAKLNYSTGMRGAGSGWPRQRIILFFQRR
jgi:hypothetical protein